MYERCQFPFTVGVYTLSDNISGISHLCGDFVDAGEEIVVDSFTVKIIHLYIVWMNSIIKSCVAIISVPSYLVFMNGNRKVTQLLYIRSTQFAIVRHLFLIYSISKVSYIPSNSTSLTHFTSNRCKCLLPRLLQRASGCS